MTLEIKEIKSIDGIECKFVDYLEFKRGIKDPEIVKTIVAKFKELLKKNERILFYAFDDEIPIGFIAGKPEGEVLESTTFYIDPDCNSDDCGSQLVKALTSKVFESGFKHYRQTEILPFNKEPTFEEQLTKDGFSFFSRVAMLLEIDEVEPNDPDLKEGYTFEPFSIEKVDELFAVMRDTNPPEHADSSIYPEMGNPEISKKMFAKFTNNFTGLNVKINPQILFDENVVGISFVFTNSPEVAFVGEVCIHPNHQRKGLGKALMNQIIKSCSEEGMKKIGLAVTTSNVVAYKLYEKLGFKVTKNYLAITKHKQ
ncbi:MAG: GNAT family N-acetyltransferase [Candidatus Heimdallarchaeota archaeon]